MEYGNKPFKVYGITVIALTPSAGRIYIDFPWSREYVPSDAEMIDATQRAAMACRYCIQEQIFTGKGFVEIVPQFCQE